jgi:hypothetical protein
MIVFMTLFGKMMGIYGTLDDYRWGERYRYN